MFLKCLETIGFKSFAERITVEFVPGMTTIVGPNGSGKSNIIDAIRWVLGEQSARSLRGQRMEDVIFQGSETRNPLNFAEVSLILNNEKGQLPIDYQEVKVTRRVYRSGESEFLINKQACRLKDIVDLFTDTGLGRESFSIIGQGKIDEILSSKADERRAVFEEAAGVMRYKKRKEQATFKLNETENNLSRVEDIIHEINQQIEPLKKQSETAKEYKRLQERLMKREIALLVTEIKTLHKEWTALSEQINLEKDKSIEQQTKIQQLDVKIVKQREQMQYLEDQLNELQTNLLNTTEILEQTEGKRNVLKEQQKHREENKQKLLTERKSLLAQLDETNKILTMERENLSVIKSKLQILKEAMQTLEEKLYNRHEAIDDEIEDLKSDLIELFNNEAVLNNEQKSFQARMGQTKRLLQQHEANHRKLTEQVQQLEAEKHQLKSVLAEQKMNIDGTERYLENLSLDIKRKQENLQNDQKKWYGLNEQIAKLKSRYDMLVEMKNNFQGFAQGVKEILQANKRGILQGIIGPVIDLVEVPSHYMTAIDTILGGQSQYVVVPNDEVARVTIDWLKKENKGRATFLPLQSIVPRSLPVPVLTSIQNERGFIGVASSLVSTRGEYKRVVEHLMGNVIVTKTLADANQIAAKTGRKYRIVTLEGDVVFPGGSISGGAQRKRNYSLFSREREIEQLQTQLRHLLKERDDLKELLQENDVKLEAMQHERTEKQKMLAEMEKTFQQSLNRNNEYALKEQSIADRVKSYRYQKEEYEAELVKLSNHMKLNDSKIVELKEKITTKQKAIEAKSDEQKTLEATYAQNQEKLHTIQLENAEQQERYKNQLEKINRINDEKIALEAKISKIEHELEEIETIGKELDSIETMEMEIDKLRENRHSLSRTIAKLTQEREQILQGIEDEERELKSQQKFNEQFLVSLQEKEIKASRLDVMLENRLQTLQKQYTITYERAEQTYGTVEDDEKVREEVNQLKQAIRALGTVNLGAIEEYERLSERHSFLNEQRNDLIEAKETLYDAIKKMDEEMISRFKSTFTQIQEAFTIVFQQLFGGGYAELVLTDPEDYLETGIDIVARPPGKKLKTLELLSGGERALTAIALLFAILRARPVPFVILDEVDAALDEANVERFATYLKTFSRESQFVVISHRKGTMEEADALYGVTMQESGVSRFVSVRLEEADNLVKTS